MTKKSLIILTAGGSGGHVYPAQALAEELKKAKYELALITDSRGQSNYKGELSKIPNYCVFCGALVGKSKLFKLKSLFKTGFGVLQACYYLWKLKPKCVVGFGGYAAFPTCCAAILMGVDLVIHEQNSVMSRTNRILSRHAKLIALSFKNTKFAPEDKSVLVGLPVRDEILKIKNSSYKKDKKLNVLILGGSQGAKIFSDVVPKAVVALSKENQEKLRIVTQVRKDDIEGAKNIYDKTDVEVEISSFFENMPELYKQANLIISRTGASSVFEIATVGRASVLVPLPTSADDHQSSNALTLKNCSYIFKQKDFKVSKIKEFLTEFIEDDKKLKLWSKLAYKEAIVDSSKLFKKAIEKEILDV
ncbi:MAG: undecaprenyldiphospho-muramoylpentapeptide beta-N-acetylglucosaminyltransferase [Alphaproteobacteria bacterium]